MKCAFKTGSPSFSLSNDFSILTKSVGNFTGRIPAHFKLYEELVFSVLGSFGMISNRHMLALGKGTATDVSTPRYKIFFVLSR